MAAVKKIKKAQNGVTQVGDSTSWKNRTLPNLTNQGLDYEIGRLSKMVTPNSGSSVIQQKIDILKREKSRRQQQNTTPKPKAKTGAKVDKKWIQKAINPKHKGYCTPMTKATCTPKRKALAMTLKKMAKARKGK